MNDKNLKVKEIIKNKTNKKANILNDCSVSSSVNIKKNKK